MLLTRSLYKYFQKQHGREESMSGWNEKNGYFHKPRRSKKYESRGKMWARKSFGRRPVPTLK